MTKEIVKYSNKMNNIPLKNFEKNDLNFFYTLCSKVKNIGSEIIEIPFEELKKSAQYKQSQERFVTDLDRMNKKLIQCSGRFETDDEIVYFNLFSTFRIIKSRKVLKVRVNPDFKWLLNDIVKEFTSFELQEYVALEGIYSKALYRILKQWKTNGKTKKIGVEEFKELLSTPDYAPKDIMKEIINPAIEDIKKHKAFENIWCEVIYAKKRGRPVEGYIFHFTKEDLKGQISFSDDEQFEKIVDNIKQKKQSKKTTKKNQFNNFEQRKNDAVYEELEDLLMNQILHENTAKYSTEKLKNLSNKELYKIDIQNVNEEDFNKIMLERFERL